MITEFRENKVGLTIGTYASLPYIHLQLESHRRYCPQIPCLVQDDGSAQRGAIEKLCRQYGVEFFSADKRNGHVVGDMKVFINGLDWARASGLDVLVKFSRRWIPLTPWYVDLMQLMDVSDAPTYCGRCTFHGFGFRSECVAMQVSTWTQGDVLDPILQQIQKGECRLVEAVIHRSAHRAFAFRSEVCRRFEARTSHHPGCGGYIDWPWMGQSRKAPRADVLWHEWAKAHEYHRALLQWGVNLYPPSSFIDSDANIKA